MTGKFAAIIGPLVYTEVTALTGSQRWAVLSMAIFFLAGLVVFQAVNERRGIEAACHGRQEARSEGQGEN